MTSRSATLRSATALCAVLVSWPPTRTAAQAPAPATVLGVGVLSRPAYLGSNERVLTVIPVVRYSGRRTFARTSQGMLEGGARTAALGGVRVGAQLAYELGRRTSHSDLLIDGDVATMPASVSYGLHAEWNATLGAAPLSALARYRKELKAERGAQVDLRLTVGVYGGEQLKAGLFAQATWADRTSNEAYYGNAVGANALPAYDADAGIASTGLGIVWSYDMGTRWMLQGSLEERRLDSQLRSSPFAERAGSRIMNVGLARRF